MRSRTCSRNGNVTAVSTRLVLIFAVVATVGIATACSFIGYKLGLHKGRVEVADKDPGNEKNNKTPSKMLDLICAVKILMPSAELDSPKNVAVRTLVAGVDSGTKSGWYQGEFAIAENRKGTLTEEGAIFRVKRPAMFRRFGEVILGEEFTVDRTDGSFHQYLEFEGGRKVEFINGFCGKYIKAPF